MTKKERNLLKGAIRRVFSRSDLRRAVIDTCALPNHVDLTRPRVKNWCECAICKTPTPKSYMQVDHNDPIIPVDSTLEAMTWDTVVNRTWCDQHNLQPICETCHNKKTKEERKLRLMHKKERTKNDK